MSNRSLAPLVRTKGTRQGNRLLGVAQDGEEASRLSNEAAHGLGEIAGTDQSEPVDGRVAEGGQIVGGVTTEDCAVVFIERRIADVMQAVFDHAPMVTDEGQQASGIGPGAWERRDEVGGLDLALALNGSLADHAADLAGAGPVEMVVQRGCRRDGPLLKPTVTFVQRAGRLLFGGAFATDLRGKKSPGRR